MKIALYVGNNGDTRALANRARNLAAVWPDATICTKPAELKGSDVVFSQMFDQIERVEEQRRFNGCGPQVCLFAANVAEIGTRAVQQGLLWLDQVPVVAHSPFHLQEIQEQMKVFAPGTARVLSRNLHYIPGGIRTDAFAPGKNDKRVWVVPYNRYNQSQKQMKLHTEVTAKALYLMRGEDIRTDYYLRNVEEELGSGKNDVSLYAVQPCPPTIEEYAANAAGSGLFVSTSAFESFGMMYLELLLAGNVGVFLDKPWVKKLLPDYPLCASAKNLPALIASVYKDYDHVREKVLPGVQSFIRTNYGFEAFSTRLRGLLEATARTKK